MTTPKKKKERTKERKKTFFRERAPLERGSFANDTPTERKKERKKERKIDREKKKERKKENFCLENAPH